MEKPQQEGSRSVTVSPLDAKMLLECGLLDNEGVSEFMAFLIEQFRNGVYFDFDDTLVNTSTIKRLLFRHARKLGVPNPKALDIYKTTDPFTLQGWSQALAMAIDRPADWDGVLERLSKRLRKLFQLKLEQPRSVVPGDSYALARFLYGIRAPLRILTKGHPAFQIEKITLFAQSLREQVVGRFPFELKVDIVAGASERAEIYKELVGEAPSVKMVCRVHPGATKSEVLLQKAEEAGRRVLYVNDKRSENREISSSGRHVLVAEIDREESGETLTASDEMFRVISLNQLVFSLREKISAL